MFRLNHESVHCPVPVLVVVVVVAKAGQEHKNEITSRLLQPSRGLNSKDFHSPRPTPTLLPPTCSPPSSTPLAMTFVEEW